MPGDQGKDQGLHRRKIQQMRDGEVPDMGGDNDPYVKPASYKDHPQGKVGKYKKGGD